MFSPLVQHYRVGLFPEFDCQPLLRAVYGKTERGRKDRCVVAERIFVTRIVAYQLFKRAVLRVILHHPALKILKIVVVLRPHKIGAIKILKIFLEAASVALIVVSRAVGVVALFLCAHE